MGVLLKPTLAYIKYLKPFDYIPLRRTNFGDFILFNTTKFMRAF